jgi:glycine/D-amino acid oxidase-like deaminating enzyme
MGSRGLKAEVKARRRMKLPSEYLDKAELRRQFGMDRTGAILSDGAAELDPARTCAACLATAQHLGARIYAPVEAIVFEPLSKGVRIATRDGPSVTCRKLVLATGYEVVKGVPRNTFDIVSSWALATTPIPNREFWPGRCLIWEAADPYLYMRTTPDNRILAGGADSGLLATKRRAAAIPNKSEDILQKVRNLLRKPDLQVAYAWAGAFAESPTGLPVLGPLAGLPAAYAILGCGGNGITYSMIASQLVRQWVQGKRDPDADLFELP